MFTDKNLMPPQIALAGTILLVLLLLFDESKSDHVVSRALWIPTIWMGIMSSRSVGAWLDGSPTTIAEGNASDRIVFTFLIILALWMLVRKKNTLSTLKNENTWIILLTLYMLLSCLWSEFPYNSFKRWLKMFGMLIMAFVVLSEQSPRLALERILRRCAYILIPFSLCLVKWIPEYGIMHSYDGTRLATGVTRHKNSLGIICALFSFFLIWSLYKKWRNKNNVSGKSSFFADSLVILISVYLLFGGAAKGYSATSITIWLFCISLMLFLCFFKKITKIVAKNLRTVISTLAILFLFSFHVILPYITALLGRQQTLTGRDIIWENVLKVAAQNPFLGVGYGGYWGLVDWEFSFNFKVNQSHDGYIDVYLQLGYVGIVLLILFIFEFARKVDRTMNADFEFGVFSICIIGSLLLYNYTEAAFIATNMFWTLAIYLSVVLSDKHNLNKN